MENNKNESEFKNVAYSYYFSENKIEDISLNFNDNINLQNANKSMNIYTNSNQNKNISFIIRFTTGQKFIINDNQNNLFISTFEKFIKENKLQSIKHKIRYILCNGQKVDLNKTLLENNINENCSVLMTIMEDNDIDFNDYKLKGFEFYGHVTKAGRDHNGNVRKNQDISLIHCSIGDIKGFNMLGVLDGHGSQGHLVSQFCHDYFIKKMEEFAHQCKLENISTPEEIYDKLSKANFKFILDCFKNADIEMTKQNLFDYNYNGTTCNLVIQLNKYLICANVGDSRAILIYDDDTKTNKGILALSDDHRPDLPQEYQRIIKNGGVVDKYINEEGEKIGLYRIYKPGSKYPGLSISRSLGDFIAKDCGLIPDPQIRILKINHNSQYLLICSDGVWKMLNNEQVRDLGNEFYNKKEIGPFCTNLVQNAVEEWEHFDIIGDDITVVCVFF